MNVNIPVMEQIMSPGIQRDSHQGGEGKDFFASLATTAGKDADNLPHDGDPFDSGEKEQSVFDRFLQEMTERYFPAGEEQANQTESGLFSVTEALGEGELLKEDIPEEILMKIKSVLGLMAVADNAVSSGEIFEKVLDSLEEKLPEGEVIPFPGTESAEAASEELKGDLFAGMEEVKDILFSGDTVQESGKGEFKEIFAAIKEEIAAIKEMLTGGKAVSEGAYIDPASAESGLKDILRALESLQEVLKEIFTEESAGDKASGVAKGDAVFAQSDLKDIQRALESLREALKEIFTEESAGDKASGVAKGDAVFAQSDLKDIQRALESLREALGASSDKGAQADSISWKSELKNIFRAIESLREAKESSADTKASSEGKAVSEGVKADALKSDLKDILRAIESLREAVKGESDKEASAKAKALKEALSKAKQAADKKADSEKTKSDFASGRKDAPAEKTAAARTVNNSFADVKARLEALEGNGKKAKAANTADSMKSSQSSAGSNDQAYRFVPSEPEKDALLNLSRFQPADMQLSKTVAVSAEELSQSPQRLKNNVMEQIFGRLTYFRESGNLPAEMRMTLNPPSLGEVVIRVFSHKGKMNAEIITGMNKVKDILETGLSDLKQRFQQMNIPLDKVEIFTAGRDADGSSQYNRESRFYDQQSSGKSNYRGDLDGEQETGDLSVETVAAGDNVGSIDMWA